MVTMKKMLVLAVFAVLFWAVACDAPLGTSVLEMNGYVTITGYGTTQEAAMAALNDKAIEYRNRFRNSGTAKCVKGAKKDGSFMPDLWSCVIKLTR